MSSEAITDLILAMGLVALSIWMTVITSGLLRCHELIHRLGEMVFKHLTGQDSDEL